MIYDLNYVHFPEHADVLRKSYFQYLVRPRCRSAARVLTTSEASRRLIVEWAKISEERVRNVGAGVDLRYQPEGPRHEAGFPYILYIGNRRPHKNLPRLFAAFARSGVYKECRLLLSGNPDRETVDLAAAAGVADSVEFAGSIPEESLPSYYRGALALAIPSLVEGFGLPALEALASGTPVLASTTGSLPEVVGSAGILTDPHDTESIAAGLSEIVFNEPLRLELIRAGLLQSKKYSWERTAAEVHEELILAARS